jgi:hypothetical protein
MSKQRQSPRKCRQMVAEKNKSVLLSRPVGFVGSSRLDGGAPSLLELDRLSFRVFAGLKLGGKSGAESNV